MTSIGPQALREDWRRMRLKHLVSLQRASADDDSSDRRYIGLEHVQSWTGQLSVAEDGASRASTGNLFEIGDVLFGKLRPYLAKAWLATFPGQCSAEFLVMRPKAIDARYLKYLCLSREFVDQVDASAYGSKMPRA